MLHEVSTTVEILQIVYGDQIISQLLDELMEINELDDSRGGVARVEIKSQEYMAQCSQKKGVEILQMVYE